MSGWPLHPLGFVAEIERDMIQPDQIKAHLPYLGLEHIENGGNILGAGIIEEGELKSTKFRFSSEHLLYGKLRPYLSKIAAPDFAGVCSTEIVPVRPGPKLDRRFLLYFLRQPSQVQLATTRSTGANLPRLSPSELARFEVPVPPLSEQRRIAAILDQADALRAKRRAALARLNEMAQAIFVEMFGDPERNPKHLNFIEIGQVIAEGPQNGLYKPAADYGDGTPIVRIDAFYNGAFTNLKDLKRVRLSSAEVSMYGLNPNDIVINRVNSIDYLGKSAIVRTLSEPTVFESNMMRLSVNRARAEPAYVIQALQTSYTKRQVCAVAKHAINQASINQKDVSHLRLLCPPIEQQQVFAKRVALIERMQVKHARAATGLSSLFASLQHRAFTGAL